MLDQNSFVRTSEGICLIEYLLWGGMDFQKSSMGLGVHKIFVARNSLVFNSSTARL
jgi:hypothetical protein